MRCAGWRSSRRPSAVEIVGSGDADVIGFARDGDDAVGVLLRVRDGRVMGREHRFLENVEGEEDAAVLDAFLVRYYLPAEARAAARGAAVSAGRAGPARRARARRPTGLVPAARHHRIAGSSWPSRTPGTCWRASASSRSRPRSGPRIRSTRWAAISACSGVPRSLVCVDISTNQGRDTVGSLVWFEGGRPRKSEYRKFRIDGLGQQDDFAAIHEVVTRYLTRRRDEGEAAARPHGHRRRQGTARRGARGGARPRHGRGHLREPRQEGGGGLPSRARREPAAAAPQPVAAAAAARPRRGAPLRRGLQPQAALASAPSPRSCSTSAASAPSAAACCSSASAAWPACAPPPSPSWPSVQGVSTRLAERILEHLQGS